MPVRLAAPAWGHTPRLRRTWFGTACAVLVMCVLVLPAAAQPRKPHHPSKPPQADKHESKDTKGGTKKVKNFDFNALDLNGRMRTPQLLYFLERANEELERASLEKRSFIPAMVRSVEEEQL